MGGELHGPLTQNCECFLRLIICYCLMEFSVHSFAKFHSNIRLWFFFFFAIVFVCLSAVLECQARIFHIYIPQLSYAS